LNQNFFFEKRSKKLLNPCAGGTMRFEPRSMRDLQKIRFMQKALISLASLRKNGLIWVPVPLCPVRPSPVRG